MTRVYEIESDEFDRIEEGKQSFIILKDDKINIKSGDVLILQDIPDEQDGVKEVKVLVDFTIYDGVKKGSVLCALKNPNQN